MDDVDDTSNEPDRLYTIGELARRTGLPVKTIRFYSDSGVVPPTDRTHAGYRLYDIRAVARLELVRTLRDLGAGLEDVQRVLHREMSLGALAATHLELLDEQLRGLQTRRAVLRAVVQQDSTTEEMRLMHKVAQMSDDERNRMIDEFWDEVSEGLNVNPEFIAWMRSAKPNLPENASTEQVEAWIELADLVSDQSFRDLVRSMNAEQAALRDEGEADAQQPQQLAEEAWEVQEVVAQEHRKGTPADSPRAVELAGRFATTFADHKGKADTPELREEIAGHFESHDARLSRYWVLLATINGWPQQKGILDDAASKWLATALRASLR